MSGTPRTDAAAAKTHGMPEGGPWLYVTSDFARQLERELAAVTKERDALKAELATLGSACDKIRRSASDEIHVYIARINNKTIEYMTLEREHEKSLFRIRRLEEAGDALLMVAKNHGADVLASAWTQAKEAKP